MQSDSLHARCAACDVHNSNGHGHGHGHTHEHMDNPGEFDKRDPPLDEAKRNWDERAFTVGIGGPVGR